MGNKLPHTPRSRIRSAARQLFMRSRERAAVLKESGYRCAKCGRKQSKAKGSEFAVQVHHRSGIGNWDRIIAAVYEHLLNKDDMVTLCKECHGKEHKT